jgi:hypothetical protein
MTRAGGVSEKLPLHRERRREALNTARASSDGRAICLGAYRANERANAVAGWFAGRLPADGTARPANAEGTRQIRKPHERWPGRPVRRERAAGGKAARPGNDGGPALADVTSVVKRARTLRQAPWRADGTRHCDASTQDGKRGSVARVSPGARTGKPICPPATPDRMSLATRGEPRERPERIGR